MTTDCVLCRWFREPWLVLFAGLIIAILLFLLRPWALLVLWLYLLALIVIGLLAIAVLLARIVPRLCRKWRADPKGSGSVGHPANGPIHLPPTIYKRPDPLIYSQAWLIDQGLAVTWDNPDIQLLEISGAPGPVSEQDLQPNHPYRIVARIWNGSSEAPAVDLRVRFSVISFGIGGGKTFVGETLVDVPVKGSAALPAIAEVPWTTPASGGHYCIQVELLWIDDANPANNVGQNNVNVKQLNSPNATFILRIGNPGTQPAAMRFAADAYRIPPIESCEVADRGGRRRARALRHRAGDHPVPEGWTVTVDEGGEAALRPGEERDVTVKIVAADGFTGEADINLNGFFDDALVGGVTLRVHS